MILGLFVYWTNAKRRANQFFLILSVLIAGWLACLALAFNAVDAVQLEFWVRQSPAAGVCILAGFHLLRLSVTHGSRSLLEVFYLARRWLFGTALIIALCQTRFFLVSVELPADGVNLNAVMEYGPGFIVCNLYYVLALIFLVTKFVSDIRRNTGIQRVELQFILLGCAACIFVGVVFAMIIPLIMGGASESVAFAPLNTIAMGVIIAYGIATRRIMGVADILRRTTAYGLVTVYLVLLVSRCMVDAKSG